MPQTGKDAGVQLKHPEGQGLTIIRIRKTNRYKVQDVPDGFPDL